MLSGKAMDVMRHKWFEGTDWEALAGKRALPPRKPRVRAGARARAHAARARGRRAGGAGRLWGRRRCSALRACRGDGCLDGRGGAGLRSATGPAPPLPILHRTCRSRPPPREPLPPDPPSPQESDCAKRLRELVENEKKSAGRSGKETVEELAECEAVFGNF
jgi:hypothetical protein